MFPGFPPPRPLFSRSQSLPVCCSNQMTPNHGGVVHRNDATAPPAGRAVYAAYANPFDEDDEPELAPIRLPYMQAPSPPPHSHSPVPMPRTYYWRPCDRHQQRALSSSSAGTRYYASTSHDNTTVTGSRPSAGDVTGNSSGVSKSASCGSCGPTTAASISELPTEKYVQRRPARERSPKYNRPRKSDNNHVAAWPSYFAAAGTLIVLACFAVLAYSFATETTFLFPAQRKAVSEREKALTGSDHGAQPTVKADGSDDLLAGSRRLVNNGVAAEHSTAGHQNTTALAGVSRPSTSSPRARPHLFPFGDRTTALFRGNDSSTTPPPPQPNTQQWDDSVCWTQACLAEGVAIKTSLDPSVNPCDDFYAYACNRWMHEHPLPRGQAVVSVDLDFLDVFTLDVFNILGRESENKLFDKLRLLLQACVASPEDYFPRLAHEALQSVALGGWPYDNDVNADAVSVSTTIGRMVTAYDLDPVFGLTLASDPTSESGMRVTFAFSGPDPLLNEGIEKGREYSFVRQAYDSLVEAIGEKSLYDPTETDVQLAAVFAHTAPLASRALKLKNCTRRVVEQLPEMGDWLFWDKVFSELAPGVWGGSIALNETEVLLPDPALFERLNETRLLSATGSKSRMANYLGFRLLLLLSPFGVGADDKNVPASLAYALYRNYPTGLHDYQACLRLVNRFEPVVAMRRLHGYWKERFIMMNDLAQMVIFLKSELNVCLKTSSLFFTSSTNIVAKILLELLSGVSWQVLNPELMEHTWTFERLSAAYEQLNVSNPGSVIIFLQSAVQSKRDATGDLSAVQWKGGFLSTTANLAYPFKVLEVPLPVFNLQRTLDESVRHLQVARIAPRIYYSLYKALYFVSGNLALDNMTWNPLRYFDTAADCLWDQYSSMSRKASNASMPSPPYASRTRDLDDLFRALALGSSLDAYAAFVEEGRKLYRFKGNEDLDATRLFFVEYAKNLCENTDPGFNATRNRARISEARKAPRSRMWYQVNGPLRNLKEFSKAFSCPQGSFMNPSNKCPLIRKHR